MIPGKECMNRLVTTRYDIRIWPRLSIQNTYYTGHIKVSYCNICFQSLSGLTNLLSAISCSTYVFSMLSLGRVLISDLVVTNLFMHTLPGMIFCFTWPHLFYIECILHEIYIRTHIHTYIHTYIHT